MICAELGSGKLDKWLKKIPATRTEGAEPDCFIKGSASDVVTVGDLSSGEVSGSSTSSIHLERAKQGLCQSCIWLSSPTHTMLSGKPKNQGRRQVLHPSGMGAHLPRVACLSRRKIQLNMSFWVEDAGRNPDGVWLCAAGSRGWFFWSDALVKLCLRHGSMR